MKTQRALGNPRNIRVILYHRILNGHGDSDRTNIGVSQAAFRKQVELLDAWGYTTITFAEYMLYCAGELDLPPKPVIITFDDAYREIYDIVFPILRHFGMKAVIFVVADKSITTSQWDKGTGEVFSLMNQHHILELQAGGCEIGSHTLTHPRLTHIAESEAREELMRSRIALEILLNAPVRSFAYPFGLLNEEIKHFAIDAGYTTACASYTGSPFFGTDTFEIRRIKALNTTNAFVFWFQLRRVYLVYRWMWWQARKLIFQNIRQENHSPYEIEAVDYTVREKLQHEPRETQTLWNH